MRFWVAALLALSASASAAPGTAPDATWSQVCARAGMAELYASAAALQAPTLPPTPLTEAEYAGLWQRDGALLRELERRRNLLASRPELRELYHALADTLAYHVGLNPVQRVVDFRDPTYRVEVPPYPALNVTGAWSYALWLKLDGPVTSDDTKVLSHSSVSVCKMTWMLSSRQDMVVYLGYPDGSRSMRRWSGLTQVGAWTHFALTYDAEQGLHLWRNGEPVGPGERLKGEALGPLISLPQQPLYIGGQDRITPGWIDDVAVYDRALTPQEVAAVFHRLPPSRGLVGAWSFDDVSAEGLAPNAFAQGRPGHLGAGVVRGEPGVEPPGWSVRFSRDRRDWVDRLRSLEGRMDAVLSEVLAGGSPPAGDPAAFRRLLHERGATFVHILEDTTTGRAQAVCINPRRIPAFRSVLLPQWPRVLRAVSAAVPMLREPDPAETQALRAALRDIARGLWDPLAETIDGHEVWLRLPPGLRGVPFAALVDSAGSFLVDRHAFARLGPPASVTGAGPIPGGALLFGDPQFGAYPERPNPMALDEGATKRGPGSSSCVVPGKALFGSAREIQYIADLVEHAEVFTGESALESLVKSRAGEASLLHFATHNFRIEPDCLEVLPADPMVCVGLQWAGTARARPESNRLADDGLLSAQEIARLRLPHRPLVVFSGCSTARAQKGRRSRLGLAQGAWLAGASASVVTLWDVDDWAMPAPMQAFYGEWLEGASPATALRKALLAARRQCLEERGHRHPGHWAALVVEAQR